MNIRMISSRLRAVALGVAMFASACSSSDPTLQLQITSPADGKNLVAADDTNAELAGLQIQVEVEATGLAADELIELLVDDVAVGTPKALSSDGRLVFQDVDILAGEHRIKVSALRGALTDEVTVRNTIECPTVAFVTPTPPSNGAARITLGPNDDRAGPACGDVFATDFVVATSAPDGTEASIIVNGLPVSSVAQVRQGAVRFEAVPLGNVGATANTVAVRLGTAAGMCESAVAFPVNIFVDCQGVSCSINPVGAGSGTVYLNQSDDVSVDAGFQGQFQVTTDTEGAAQDIELIVDGNETNALSVTPTAEGVATFGNVTLSEGEHTLQARCSDAVGNVRPSPAVTLTVDITPCPVDITDPAAPASGQPDPLITVNNDADGTAPNIQLDVQGSSTGTGCQALRCDTASGVAGVEFGLYETMFTRRVTLGASTTQTLVCETRDIAGNIGRVERAVRVRPPDDMPAAQIVTPVTGASFNVAGTGGRIADLTPTGNSTCEVAFEVRCTDPGAGNTVELIRVDTAASLASADCVADASVAAPFAGKAVFASVSLPSVQDISSYQVIARHVADGLTGDSDAIALTVDCLAPSLAIRRPLICPFTLRVGQDEIPGTAGIQYGTNVNNEFDSDQPVTLTIRPAGGGAPVYTATQTALTGTTVRFDGATYSSGGTLVVEATTTDVNGNVGTSPTCEVTVVDLPTLAIQEPTNNAVLSSGDDCNAGAAGLQVRVRATTDAANGSAAEITVNADPPIAATVSAGAVDECIDVADGTGIAIKVAVTDAVRGTVEATTTVTVDTQPPANPISDLTRSAVLDRRGGQVELSWTAVADAGGGMLSAYLLRCDDAAIANETDWGNAAVQAVMTTPAAVPSGGPAPTQSQSLSGLRLAERTFCVLRGADATGALTPLPAASTEVTVDFLEATVAPTGGADFGAQVVPVGDVNGDGVDDLLVSGVQPASTTDLNVYLYFGSTTGLSTVPSVTIDGTGVANFGFSIAGLGDVNADGRNDFAVGAYGTEGGRGSVYVWFGRASGTPWPVSVGAATADLILRSDDEVAGGYDDAAWFGRSVAPAGDFNNDNVADILVGAPIAGVAAVGDFVGDVYVILGDAGLTGTVNVPGLTGGPNQPRTFMFRPTTTATRQLGERVASIGGDVNGDNFDDILVGASGDALGTTTATGRAFYAYGRAHSGSGMDAIPEAELFEIATGDANGFPSNLHALGDIDGDSFLDVGLYGQPPTFRVLTVYFGNAAGTYSAASSVVVTNDLNTGDRFGLSAGMGQHPTLGGFGDIDRDGQTDLLVGARYLNASIEGAAHLFYDVSQGTPIVRTEGAQLAPTGEVSAHVGDLNGDGYADIAIGNPTAGSGVGNMLIKY